MYRGLTTTVLTAYLGPPTPTIPQSEHVEGTISDTPKFNQPSGLPSHQIASFYPLGEYKIVIASFIC